MQPTRAAETERARLAQTFSALCAIPSPSGEEAAVAAWLREELGAMGLSVDVDEHGNLLARLASAQRPDDFVLLCTHMDTVPHDGIAIEPVLQDGWWSNANAAILGADNKAAVAVVVEVVRRAATQGAPIGIEALFTVREEIGLQGAAAFDATTLSSRLGWVFDHATPIGQLIVGSPTYMRLIADLRGAAAHAGIAPETGRSAILAAAKAIAAMRLGRLDEETTANVGVIAGGTGRNVVPEHCRIEAEARSLSEPVVEALIAEMVDHLHDGANDPDCPCDLDVVVERDFTGYRVPPDAPALQIAARSLQACGFAPVSVSSGGGSDANALRLAGIDCVNVANGTERPHQPDERVSNDALNAMLDVVLTLLPTAAAE